MQKDFISERKKKMQSAQLIPLSFLLAIAVGTILLMLPFSTVEGESTDIVTALFTATTSICVTGLVVVDSFAHWTLFGKIIILIMIQLGGLGIISVTSILMLAIHKRFSLEQSIVLHDAFNLSTVSGLMKFLAGVFKGTFLVEGIGALIYMIVFVPKFGPVGIWYSFFTSISAFCNAGIDILGPDSLISYNMNPIIIINTSLLIILGGLGYVVWFDFSKGISEGIKKGYSLYLIFRRVSEHSKLVIKVTAFLILVGALGVFLMEYSNPDTIGNMSFGGKVMNSLFQSITFRTAGFAAVPQDKLTEGTCVMGLLWMFIGGSPVGTAGGVKTITFFFCFLNTISFIRNRNENVVCGRKVTSDMIHKASAIVSVSVLVTFILLILLVCAEDVNLLDASYEMFSATATVGLSRCLTPSLHTGGRLIVIIAMYLGRIGPISMALFFNQGGNKERNNISFAKGNYFVG
ncbi:trk system potassium uptake protein TrkH [Lachnospiraceae bacterium]|nr:trk system potassium uptake protein TrkH [Lachnospiraceae bacterium]